MYPPLRVRLTQFPSSCRLQDVGRNVTNIFISNKTSDSSAGSVTPEIIKIVSSNVRSTTATMTINTRTGGTVYYLCIDAGYPIIDNSSQIIAMSNQNGLTGTVESSAENVYSGQTAQINYRGVVELSTLSSSTKYNFYAILNS